MYDPRTDHTVNPGQMFSAMIQDRIDQRMIRVSGRRVYDHPLGFIHDQNIFIFIQNIQRNIFCCNIQRFRIRHFHINLIPLIQLIICFHLFPIHKDQTVL